MPIYEYACSRCQHRFELLQPVGAALPETCPSCGAPDIRKLVSASSFILKGSGWYRDSYGLRTAPPTPDGGSSTTHTSSQSSSGSTASSPASTSSEAPGASTSSGAAASPGTATGSTTAQAAK